MEKLYRKVGKKYVEAGYGGVPDLVPGIWLVQKDVHSKSQTSLVWRVGDLKRPVDVVTHAALQSMTSKLAQYLLKLSEEDSEEFKQAKEQLGGYLHGAPSFYNISASDLASLFLRQIAMEVEEGVLIDWGTAMMKFREETSQHLKPRAEFEERVKVLYEFIDFMKNKGYELKQNVR
jgi:hypothetical protein